LRLLDSPDGRTAPLRPLLAKELREIAGGRALWTMLLLICPLIGYSLSQAVLLYADASKAGLQSPVLASSLSPLDGILVPTFGAFYVAVTLLFPFVAIRVLSQEKETGGLRLLVQLPYRTSTLISAKLVAVLFAWFLVSIPVLSALAVWAMIGGHLSPPETLNLILGHLLYGLLVGAIALFAASVAESAPTAAIITLAFTISSWVLDFTIAGQPGFLEWIARLSLTQTLRTFEQGLLSVGLVLGIVAAICGFSALAVVWLPPGVSTRSKFVRSAAVVLVTVLLFGAVAQIKLSIDMTEDRRNSFAAADQRLLATLADPLIINVHLAPEDPRYADLQRNVLAKLERVMPNVAVRLAAHRQGVPSSSADAAYGEVEYVYGTRSDTSRSTSPREILPLLYNLAGVPNPSAVSGGEYPGYPLVANGYLTLPWFFAGFPLLVGLAWWRHRRSPPSDPFSAHEGGRP
jgi:ABC-2 type transport system permease protein